MIKILGRKRRRIKRNRDRSEKKKRRMTLAKAKIVSNHNSSFDNLSSSILEKGEIIMFKTNNVSLHSKSMTRVR